MSKCYVLRDNFQYLWLNVREEIINSSSTDAYPSASFVNNLDEHQKLLLRFGGWSLQFQNSAFIPD